MTPARRAGVASLSGLYTTNPSVTAGGQKSPAARVDAVLASASRHETAGPTERAAKKMVLRPMVMVDASSSEVPSCVDLAMEDLERRSTACRRETDGFVRSGREYETFALHACESALDCMIMVSIAIFLVYSREIMMYLAYYVYIPFASCKCM